MPDAKGKATRTTFAKRPEAPRGGDGWGGAPKGAGSHAERAPVFEAGNEAARGYHDMSKSELLAALDERKWLIAMGLEQAEMVQARALDSYEARHLGTPTQTLQHSGPDGGAILTSLTVTFRKPGEQQS